MGSQVDPDTFITLLKHKALILDYIFFLFYFLLTLHLEIKFIWFARWSYTKILFLLNRYVAFATSFLVLHNQLFVNIPKQTCNSTWPAVAWLILFKTVVSQAILGIRTWAVWKRNKVVGVILVAAMIANFFVILFSNRAIIRSIEYASPPYPGYKGCFIIKASKTLWVSYASLTAVEATFLTSMSISAFRSYRVRRTNGLWFVVHRDGILVYVYLLLIGAANLVFSIVLPPDLKIVLTPLSEVLYTVLPARIILNIRVIGHQGVRTELHTDCYQDAPQAVSMPLQFIVSQGSDIITTDGVIADDRTIDHGTSKVDSGTSVV